VSSYRGNGDRCPTCGMTYGDFRCPLITTYREAFECLMDGSDDPSEWRYKRRRTVLGYWHMCKKQDWEQHKRDCEEAASFEADAEHGDAWEPPMAHLTIALDEGLPF
jgi:hypothetical protein